MGRFHQALPFSTNAFLPSGPENYIDPKTVRDEWAIVQRAILADESQDTRVIGRPIEEIFYQQTPPSQSVEDQRFRFPLAHNNAMVVYFGLRAH